MSKTEALPELPELPAPDYWSTRDDDTPLFTAEQMREYARAALAQQPAASGEPAVDYFRVQAIADDLGMTYNELSRAIRHYLAAAPQPAPARVPLTVAEIDAYFGPDASAWVQETKREIFHAGARYAERARDMAAPAVPPGWQLVPVEPTEAMCKAAVVFANGNAVYRNVAAEALKIEESIYGEAYAAMLATAPTAQQEPKP